MLTELHAQRWSAKLRRVNHSPIALTPPPEPHQTSKASPMNGRGYCHEVSNRRCNRYRARSIVGGGELASAWLKLILTCAVSVIFTLLPMISTCSTVQCHRFG